MAGAKLIAVVLTIIVVGAFGAMGAGSLIAALQGEPEPELMTSLPLPRI